MLKPEIYLRIIILSIILAIFACNKEDGETDQYHPNANKMDTIMHDGIVRTYKLHIPASYSDGTKIPLVIAIHGYTSSAISFENGTLLSDKADAEGFIVVYPNGLKYPWTTSNPQAWNAGGGYEEWTGGTDDVGFIDQMIELICKYYTIDRNRIFVTGHSNGSFMAYRLAYELSDKITAIAPHSGQMLYLPIIAPTYKVSVLHLHALDDSSVPYYGNQNEQAVDEILNHWASWFSCSQQPDTTFKNSDYLIKEWGCPGNTVLKLYLLNKGGHSWFKSSNSCIQANDIIWEFFKAHPKKVD
jgi:polyhydroxybutyrate depolymerase